MALFPKMAILSLPPPILHGDKQTLRCFWRRSFVVAVLSIPDDLNRAMPVATNVVNNSVEEEIDLIDHIKHEIAVGSRPESRAKSPLVGVGSPSSQVRVDAPAIEEQVVMISSIPDPWPSSLAMSFVKGNHKHLCYLGDFRSMG